VPTLDGIDVSHHQGNVKWRQVAGREPPLRFVMSRMTHGGRGNEDLRFDDKAERNRDGMRAAFPDSPRGFYHFLGMSDPDVQALHFKSAVGDLLDGEFVMLDVEPDPAARVPELPVPHILATLEGIEGAFDVTPGLYIGRFYPGALDPRLYRFPLVLPAWVSRRRFVQLASEMGRPVTIWQWGGSIGGQSVPGIEGIVDCNKIWDEELFEAMQSPGRVDPGLLRLIGPLDRGDRGNSVVLLQTLLIEHGIIRDRDVNRDGVFGPGTERAVEKFQAENGIRPTGRVNRATWRALGVARRILGGSET
jgi:GH25 family lysozyme M1 (1,4-beta-N-acetylmuramidase)